jgi:hypothetical protein
VLPAGAAGGSTQALPIVDAEAAAKLLMAWPAVTETSTAYTCVMAMDDTAVATK